MITDPRYITNPSTYHMINNFSAHFQELIGTIPQLMKLIILSNPSRLKTHVGMKKSP